MTQEPQLSSDLDQRVVAEQVRAHYSQIPAMVIAPTLGGLFTAWVLWGAVRNDYLVIGMVGVTGLSAARLVIYRSYFAASPERAAQPRWKVIAVAATIVSGCIWGSAAPFLYPPNAPGYEVYLLVLLTLLPIVPVAALAVYMPAFYGYYIPCIVPFVVSLAVAGDRPELMTAALLVMMMGAMVTFARRYSAGLAQAIALRLQLAEKSEALEHAIQHKTRFIAAASHDLRQPVHAMGLFLESIRQGGEFTGANDEVACIEACLGTLRSMLDDMLEISKLDARVVNVEPRDLDAGALLRKLRDEYAPLAARQQLQFRLRARDVVVFSDPALLERILRNLLSNALKFTLRGGVALVCRPRGSMAWLQVIDTGTGIRATQLERIFEEFTQLDNAERNSAKGLGLGLAIVQRTARLLGHAVRVRSAPGRGSTFTIELPVGHGKLQAIAPVAARETPPIVSRRLVVIVDDDEAIGASTAVLLRRWGHRVVVARSGAQARDALLATRAEADLLIVDHQLADGESGMRAIELLQQAAGRKVPAIVITGDTAPQRIRESYAAGHALLHKPVDPRRLLACIASTGVNAGDTTPTL